MPSSPRSVLFSAGVIKNGNTAKTIMTAKTIKTFNKNISNR
jgi:hypothetical protein